FEKLSGWVHLIPSNLLLQKIQESLRLCAAWGCFGEKSMLSKLTLKIDGMHCTSCAMDIDGELEDTDGVIESNTNYAKGVTEVKFESEKVDQQKIASIISTLGYSVL
ncbi:heavy-metal-associated domain-containing protein, partial [Candidatus Roizmanbacteria bacterium]|nr:heavy-metal-associated domain-containing protein [Candidatus Roizmanbacteria bacterium]